MADRELVTRTGKAASLNASDYDQNVNSMNGTVEEVTGATHTIAVTDQGKTIQYNNGTAIAVTIPTAATIKAAMDASVDNFKIRVKNIGAGVVTITSTDNIDGSLTLALAQYDSALIQTNADNSSWLAVEKDIFVESVVKSAFLYRSTNLAITNNVLTQIAFGSTGSVFDTDTFTDNDPDLTVDVTGIYQVGINCGYTNTSSTAIDAAFTIEVNGATSTERIWQKDTPAGAQWFTATTLISLTAGDDLSLHCRVTAATGSSFINAGTQIWATRVE